MIGQISIFDLLPEQGIPAECLCNYINHVLVLRPTKLDREGVPKGLEFCHYFIEGPVYSGIFIGT